MNRHGSPMHAMGLLIALMVLLGAWTDAKARIHSLTGNVRFQIGPALPLPITFALPPQGGIVAISAATIRQHGVHAPSAPARVVLDPGQLTYPGTSLVNLGLNFPNPPGAAVFQVATQLSFSYPREAASWRAGGRTGAPIVTFCGQPGSTMTDNGNPGCAGGTGASGLLRYTATSNQFGGPAQAAVRGSGNIAFDHASVQGPCAACLISFANLQPPPTGAWGGPFGYTHVSSPSVPSPGIFIGTVGAGGTVIALNTPLGPGVGSTGTSWGGPLTTGMVTASNPSANEKFILTGSDGRNPGNGTGTLSLVSGGFSQRAISGPNANRGWVNLMIGPVVSKVPMMPLLGAVVLVGALGLSFATIRRGRRR